MKPAVKPFLFAALIALSLVLAACSGPKATSGGGGNGGGGGGGSSTFTVGGTVTGLKGTGLVLQNNGGDDLTITADGSFTFKTLLVTNAAYKVTIKTQPSSPAQNCTVSNASGTATANVTNVQVVCPIPTFNIGG